MISLRHEMEKTDELKRSEEMREFLAKECTQIIRTVSDYAVEVDARLLSEFQAHLKAIAASAEAAASPEHYFAVQSNFRGEVRRYRDLNAEQIVRIRAELSNATAAMKKLAEAVTSSGSDLGSQMEGHLVSLETAAHSRNLDVILPRIEEAASGLRTSYQEMQRINRATIAQMEDEIRRLHQDIAEERRTMYLDKQSGAWIRQKVDLRIDDLLRQGEAFWILFLRWDLKTDLAKHPGAADQTTQAMVKRLQGILGKDALIGRWNPHIFAVVIELDPSTEEQVTKEIRARISGMYSVQENGENVAVCMEVHTAVARAPRGTKAMHFLPTLGHVTTSLGHS